MTDYVDESNTEILTFKRQFFGSRAQGDFLLIWVNSIMITKTTNNDPDSMSSDIILRQPSGWFQKVA